MSDGLPMLEIHGKTMNVNVFFKTLLVFDGLPMLAILGKSIKINILKELF